MISEQHSVRYVTVLLAFCRNQFIVFRDIFEKYIDECSSECDVSAKKYISIFISYNVDFCIFIVWQVCCYNIIPSLWSKNVNHSQYGFICVVKFLVSFYFIICSKSMSYSFDVFLHETCLQCLCSH